LRTWENGIVVVAAEAAAETRVRNAKERERRDRGTPDLTSQWNDAISLIGVWGVGFGE
jgi:hypothetical protein